VVTVLVVDDTEDVRFLYDAVLTRSGYEVLQAASGQDALSMLRAGDQPDVVVLDVQMPDMDGWDTLHAIRSDPRSRGIPVILCTVKSSENSTQRAWDAGCDGFLAKPFMIEELIAELAKVVAPSNHENGPTDEPGIGHGYSGQGPDES